METVRLIIREAKIMKDVIIAANQLTNDEYDFQAKRIFKLEAQDKLEKGVQRFREVIKLSPLCARKVKIILELDSTSTYNFAREIMISFTRQEIKDSYA